MNVLTIDTSQLTQFAGKLQNMSKALDQAVDDVLNKNAIEMRQGAIDNLIRNKTTNEGFLIGAILPVQVEHLKKTISADKNYAAPVEFGTGAYAAAYVASLPPDWQTFAAQFRGKPTGGNFKQMVQRIARWVTKKGIQGTYSVKTKKRTGNKIQNRLDDFALAYAIARSILKHGARPHPFLYPAFVQQKPILEKDLDTAIKTVI